MGADVRLDPASPGNKPSPTSRPAAASLTPSPRARRTIPWAGTASPGGLSRCRTKRPNSAYVSIPSSCARSRARRRRA
jgi:hypothetical protein